MATAQAARSSRWHFKSFELVLGVASYRRHDARRAVLVRPFPDGGESMDLMARLIPPFESPAHILGTDPLGRDVLARVIVGGKISLMVGVFSVIGAVILGTHLSASLRAIIAAWPKSCSCGLPISSLPCRSS